LKGCGQYKPNQNHRQEPAHRYLDRKQQVEKKKKIKERERERESETRSRALREKDIPLRQYKARKGLERQEAKEKMKTAWT
jgi:hypothetical protein